MREETEEKEEEEYESLFRVKRISGRLLVSKRPGKGDPVLVSNCFVVRVDATMRRRTNKKKKKRATRSSSRRCCESPTIAASRMLRAF